MEYPGCDGFRFHFKWETTGQKKVTFSKIINSRYLHLKSLHKAFSICDQFLPISLFKPLRRERKHAEDDEVVKINSLRGWPFELFRSS